MNKILMLLLLASCNAYGMEKSLTDLQTQHMHQVIGELERQSANITDYEKIEIKNCYMGVVAHSNIVADLATATGLDNGFVRSALRAVQALHPSQYVIAQIFKNRR
jgi:hypothetical protein